MSLRERIAYYICPTLKAEVGALRDGNTRIVLEHGKLLDRLSTYTEYCMNEKCPRGGLPVEIVRPAVGGARDA